MKVSQNRPNQGPLFPALSGFSGGEKLVEGGNKREKETEDRKREKKMERSIDNDDDSWVRNKPNKLVYKKACN